MENSSKINRESHKVIGERHALALPIELEEGPPPYLPRAALAILSGLVVMLLVWANIAQVRELSVVSGEIAPSGSARQVAHLEGGIVEEVFVKPGDSVIEAQPLVRLRTESAGSDYDRYEVRRANLLIRMERLMAQTNNKRPDFSEYEAGWPALVEEQRSIYEAATKQYRADVSSLKAREEGAISEVTKVTAELKSENELLKYAREQFKIQDELIKDGFTSRQAYLEVKASVSSSEANVAAAKARFVQAKKALDGVRSELESAEAQYNTLVAEERAQAVAELAELAEPLQSSKDRIERLTVRAPIAGIVNDVLVNGRGDVIRAGALLVEITPSGEKLLAEVRVEPKDIGHVAIGQKTEIVVSTFDPNRYGKIDGEIAHISSDSFTDERTGESYYKAYVALDRQEIGKGLAVRPLSPGMEVRAEIITQSRTLMQYMLKPVSRSFSNAFTER